MGPVNAPKQCYVPTRLLTERDVLCSRLFYLQLDIHAGILQELLKDLRVAQLACVTARKLDNDRSPIVTGLLGERASLLRVADIVELFPCIAPPRGLLPHETG